MPSFTRVAFTVLSAVAATTTLSLVDSAAASPFASYSLSEPALFRRVDTPSVAAPQSVNASDLALRARALLDEVTSIIGEGDPDESGDGKFLLSGVIKLALTSCHSRV
jgi:hypothetical protein